MSTQADLEALKKRAADLADEASELEAHAVNLEVELAAFTLPEPPPEPDDKLTWWPPALSSPVTINLPTGGGTVTLPAGRDVILRCPNPVLAGTIVLRGAPRNVVLIGGEWNIATGGRGDNACINVGGGTPGDCPTGIFHMEGVWFRGGGLNEAIDLRCPATTVQIQNTRIERLIGGSTQGHGDIIQPTSGFKELRVDRMTGGSDYQGLFLRVAYNTPGGPIFLRRINLKATASGTAKLYSFWQEETDAPENTGGTFNTGRIYAEDLYVSGGTTGKAPKDLVTMAYPGAQANAPALTDGMLWWPTKPDRFRTLGGGPGFITAGDPPEDFVPAGVAGIGYTTPGYV